MGYDCCPIFTRRRRSLYKDFAVVICKSSARVGEQSAGLRREGVKSTEEEVKSSFQLDFKTPVRDLYLVRLVILVIPQRDGHDKSIT